MSVQPSSVSSMFTATMLSAQAGSVQAIGSCCAEEDWTAIKDPKEKKRIQNRIAQRSYRRRLKARLEKLQSKVDHHERMKLQAFEREETESGNNGANAAPQPASMPCNQVATPATTAEPMTSKSPEESQMLPQCFYGQTIEDGDRNLFAQSAAAQSLSRHLSPLRNMPEPDSKFMHDSRMPKAIAEDKLDNQHGERSYLNFESQREHTPIGEIELCATSEIDQADNSTHIFTPDDSSSLDFEFNSPGGVWKPDILTPATPQTASSAPRYVSARQTSATSSVPIDRVESRCAMPVSPDVSAEKSSLDEGLEFILECAETIGFANFDSLVTTYYNENFCESSPLSNEQRLSRNRRLPKVFAEIFQATDRWSDWERYGLRDEILKQTESMLISERKGAMDALGAGIGPLVDAHNDAHSIPGANAMLGMKRTIRNELPNLWAFMMSLASQNRALRKHDHSNTVLAIVILLQCSGSIPNDQLIRLLTSCILNRDGEISRMNTFI